MSSVLINAGLLKQQRNSQTIDKDKEGNEAEEMIET